MYVAQDEAGYVAVGRDAALEIIQREMTAFARRARGVAAHMHPELSLVSFTLLSHVEFQPGCRATDLAAHYLLDKSTISRQVSVLERAGLVARSADPVDARVHVLHLTDHGVEMLAQVNEARRRAFRQRLADWGEADLDRFAGYLLRYNAPGGETGDESGRESVPSVE
ncbi:MarR family winged helix-turn-helix transcriptional regulator [Streptomyces sp. GZWMJZ-114]|uniref:MarR family winged helix-turn-helix transcriptional regulator n=1 Tax=Streptomyces sp. GZWMJZ-114 TaxID=2494734 RepID=UPI001012835F|nr:MarR family winged helix-turn-helix transcriptional regulator [Streptomyces sp. GZWMJZ-114]